jgi:hypothetical protein
MKRLAALAFALLLSWLASCTRPPIMYHEDMPAYAPRWGPPETRFGYHRTFWNDDGFWRPDDYFNLGTRVGQRLGPLAFEQGILANMGETEAGLGIHAGIGLVSPALMLRGSWAPVHVWGLLEYTRLDFVPDHWWQASLLYGSQRKRDGYGWAVGARASKLGIGPVLFGEYCSGVLSLRAEASASLASPWAGDRTVGQLYSIGIGAAHHGRR